MSVNTLLEDAAHGRLPPWAQPSRRRFEHMARVAALLGEWARLLHLPAVEQRRWRAAGFLHDALRDARPDDLRRDLPEPLRDVEGKLLHGPAVAERLRADGVGDEPFLRAVAYHTIGHPELDELGCALFIADYVEPGRRYEPHRLAVLRARMPGARAEVLRDVLRSRMRLRLDGDRPIRAETVAFWNALMGPVHGHRQAR